MCSAIGFRDDAWPDPKGRLRLFAVIRPDGTSREVLSEILYFNLCASRKEFYGSLWCIAQRI